MRFTNVTVEAEENMIKYMSRILKRSTLMFVILTTSGCLDFDVENLNAPDEARALATPSDVESLIKGSFCNTTRPLKVEHPI